MCAFVVALALQACYVPPTQASVTASLAAEDEAPEEEQEDVDDGEPDNGENGEVGEATAAPSFNPPGGVYGAGSAPFGDGVVLSSDTDGATIYYTLDGADPDTNSATIDSGESVILDRSDGQTEIRAFADADDHTPSGVVSEIYISEFVLTYDENFSEGQGTPPGEVTGAYQSEITVDDEGNLAKDGHAFAGWNTDAGASGEWYQPGASLTLTGDITLYAQWDSGDGEFDVDPWEADGLEITFEPFPVGSIEPGAEHEIGASVNADSGNAQVESYQWLVDNEQVDGAGGAGDPESFTFVRDTIGTYLVSLEVTVTVDGQAKLYIKSREIEVMPEFD